MPEQAPEYRVVEPCFIEPFSFLKDPPPGVNGVGSTIEFWGPPGPHLEPLNDAAREAMETWYESKVDPKEQPFPVKDDRGNFLTEGAHTPRTKYRRREYTAGERHGVKITGLPSREASGPNPLSLAELQLRGDRGNTDQRPGPARAPEDSPNAGMKVKASAPATSTVKVS